MSGDRTLRGVDAPAAPAVAADKRWLHRGQRWVTPADRGLFTPAAFSVDVLEAERAKRFICEHHYSGTMVAAHLSVGLFGPGAQLVGVAALSEPAGPAVLAKYGGPLAAASVELGRFVCLPEVAYNGETWFLSRAFKLAQRERGVRAVLSFADPTEWRALERVVKPQHWGTIYQATNALFVGPAMPRTHIVGPDGRPFSPRALSKLRNLERGWEYAERQLLAMGAPARGDLTVPEWIAGRSTWPGFANRRHAGNLAYVFGLDDLARAALKVHHAERLQAYPKRAVA